MKYKKTLISLAAACAIFAAWEKSENTNSNKETNSGFYSENEVTPGDAIAIVGQVEATKDFTTFVYRCDKVRRFIAVIENPESAPRLRLVMATNEGDKSAKHRFVPDTRTWLFTDNNGTAWKVEAGQITGHGGKYEGTICKFNQNESTLFKEASEKEDLLKGLEV